MNALFSLSDAELMETADLSEADFDELERQLVIRAACLGWTGDPLRQPLEVVAAVVRGILFARPPSCENRQRDSVQNVTYFSESKKRKATLAN